MRVGAWTTRALRRCAREQTGFTLLELLSALLVVSLGVMGLITTLDGSRDLISFNEAKETAVHVGEQELERAQALVTDGASYGTFALDATPTACSSGGDVCDENNPAWYVTGAWYRWDQTPRGQVCDASGNPALNCEELIVAPGTGTVKAVRETTNVPGPSGTRLRVQMQRFVTYVDDDCVKEPPNVLGCVHDQNYKRITVAVRVLRIDGGPGAGSSNLFNGGPGRPILLSTTVRNPDA